MSNFQQPPIGGAIGSVQVNGKAVDVSLGSSWGPWFLNVQNALTAISNASGTYLTTTVATATYATLASLSTTNTNVTNVTTTVSGHTTTLGTHTTDIGALQTNVTALQAIDLTSAQLSALTGGSTTDAASYHTHKTLPAGGTSAPPLKFTSGTLATSAQAGALEYNGDWYATDSSSYRGKIVIAKGTNPAPTQLLASGSGSGSPWTHQNTSGNLEQVVIASNGLTVAASISRDGTNYYQFETNTAATIILANNDYVKITYATSPTVMSFIL